MPLNKLQNYDCITFGQNHVWMWFEKRDEAQTFKIIISLGEPILFIWLLNAN